MSHRLTLQAFPYEQNLTSDSINRHYFEYNLICDPDDYN